MFPTNRSLKIGLVSLVLGMILSLASAWCEVEAHLKNGQPVQEIGKQSTGTTIYKDNPPYYLASSMAIRLFSIGALFIVVGTLQIQRAQLHERVVSLEREIESIRNRAVSA